MSPENPNVPRGGTALVTVTLTRRDGFDGPVDVAADRLPPGVTAAPGAGRARGDDGHPLALGRRLGPGVLAADLAGDRAGARRPGARSATTSTRAGPRGLGHGHARAEPQGGGHADAGRDPARAAR